MLKELHAVHSGIVRMKSLSKENIFGGLVWMQKLKIMVVVIVKKVGLIFKRCPFILGSFQIGLGKGYMSI